MSAEDRNAVETQVASLRSALQGSDVEAVRGGMSTLMETVSRVSTAAYQASASEGGSNGADGDGSSGGAEEGEPAGARSGGGSEGDDTVEGEYKEV